MTPDDLAAIKATVHHNGPATLPGIVDALCDALEDAWAARDKWRLAVIDQVREANRPALDRLEVAEMRERAERAERDRDYYIRELARVGDQNVHMSAALARVRVVLDTSCCRCSACDEIRAAIEGDREIGWDK